MKISLSQLEGCFEGIVPAKIATCSTDGIPNASYLSHVFYVDEKHVATSYQFFNKTRANLLANPFASIQVRDPLSLQSYRLQASYKRSEESGPIFDQMSVKLDVIAASEGMGSVFKLKAADIYEVTSIEPMGKRSEPAASSITESAKDFEFVRMLSEKLNATRDLEEFIDVSLQLMSRYLNWSHIIFLLTDRTQQTLTTHASWGYPLGGVGSEVEMGKGLIGLSAQLKRNLQISGLNEGLRYAQAVKQCLSQANVDRRIPLPGLDKPASQAAFPIVSNQNCLGVLFVESPTKPYWGSRDVALLSIFANMLAFGLRSFEDKNNIVSTKDYDSIPMKALNYDWKFRYVTGEDVIFINDQYLIKNIPARILRYLIEAYTQQGREEFSNMELRSVGVLQLPDIKDNLEARLILLRKRLEEKESGVRIQSVGRGRFKIIVQGKITIQVGE